MIIINGEEWRILIVSPFHPQLLNRNNEFTLGCCNDFTKTIYISEGLTDFYFRKVLCHEIVHAAMFSYNVFLEHEEEEIIADLIATYGKEIIDITNIVFKKMRDKK